MNRSVGLSLLLALCVPLALAGQAPSAPDAPPNWRPGMPRVGGLPILYMDSTVFSGWLPRDSIRSLVGGYSSAAPWRTCADSTGSFRGADAQRRLDGDNDAESHNPCYQTQYLMVGRTETDGSFIGFLLERGPVRLQVGLRGPPPGPWRWGMTVIRVHGGPVVGKLPAYPVAGRIADGRIEWVVHYTTQDSVTYTSTTAHPDGRIEGTVYYPPSLWMKASAAVWVFYPLGGEPLLKP